MKNLALLLLIILFPAIVWAQTTVTGSVKTTDGESLPGVSILLEGASTGTVTDVNGNYSMKVNDLSTDKLVFSFIGYKSQTISLNGISKHDIVLEQALQDLDEVVVVGYGEVRKRDLTGSVSKVSEQENIARQYNTVDAMLQGRAAGVQVSSNAGAPGSAISVRIRGTNSLRGNNEPLYVIDGVIISSAAEDVSDASTDSNDLQSQQNGLTGLNPRDIESVEILKDASATAIYGSRGANGVVLITTKKGQVSRDKAKINVYATTDFSWLAKKIDVLSPLEYVDYQNELQVLNGAAGPKYKVDNGEVYGITYTTDGSGNTVPVVGTTPLKQIDWQDEMYDLAISTSTGLSLSGQNKSTNYYFSSGYNNIRGIVETTKIKQGDMRLNLTTDLTPKLKFENRALLMYQQGSFANGGSKSGGTRSFTKQILSYRPVVDYSGEDSEDLNLEISNPYAWITDYDDLTEEIRVNLSTSFEYQIIKGLKYKIQGGVDYRTKDRERWYGPEIFAGNLANGKANYSNLKRYSYTLDNILTFNKKIAGKSMINATAAVTYDGNNIKNDIYEIGDFPVKTLRSKAPQLGQIVQQPLAYLYNDEEIFSLLGRVNYSINDKYIFTGSFRADQSSKFSSGNQWGYFPSFAGAWRVSEEEFMKDGFFYNLKLRLGWGVTGNQAINPYQTLSTYSSTYYSNAGNGSILANVPSRIANEDLTWETTAQYNGGVDASVFDGKLNVTFDMYYKKTKDLLQEIQLPTSAGFSAMTINRGEIENKGIELSIDGKIINKKDFTFSAGGHISVNRNKVLNLGLAPSTIWIDGVSHEEIYYLGNNVSTGNYLKCPANIFMEGQPIGMFWGYETNGVYKDQAAADAGPKYGGNPNKAGDLIYVDHSGNGNIGLEDLTFIGNPNPDFTYGFDFDFTFYGFTLKALFDGVYGNDIANGYNTELGFAESNTKNVLNDAYMDAWRADKPEGTYTRLGYTIDGKGFPDVIVESGSYLRLNNVTLGYDIPFKNSWLENLNLYVSGRNLFYITNYSGYEPQVTSFLYDGSIMGVDWVGTPNVKSFLFGVNVTF